ncbi:MAG: DUF192 domain-containing protein [Sporomusaceae bacterium]|nr:DUF192 domain-containing protein [Sporomusaceae bacterium]
MCIKNITKGTVVADHMRPAATFWQRLKGLLGTSSLPIGHGLVIKPCSSVHTFGMNYPIDVLFVDRHHRIIKVVENLLPGKVSMASGSQYVVELPAGTARLAACSAGDILELQ